MATHGTRKMPESVKKMLAARKRRNPGGKKQRARGTREWVARDSGGHARLLQTAAEIRQGKRKHRASMKVAHVRAMEGAAFNRQWGGGGTLDDQIRNPGDKQTPLLVYEYSHRNSSAAGIDEQAATELYLSAKSDGRLYARFTKHVVANYAKKMKAGKYNRSRAIDGLLPGLEQAAKDYAREFDSPGNWSRLFSVATRREAAKMWLPEIEDAAKYEAKARNPGGKQSPLLVYEARTPSNSHGTRIYLNEDGTYTTEILDGGRSRGRVPGYSLEQLGTWLKNANKPHSRVLYNFLFYPSRNPGGKRARAANGRFKRSR